MISEPVFNVNIEQYILSILINHNDAYDEISTSLKKDDFYIESHRIIYTTIQKRLQQGQPVDILILMHHLQDSKQSATYIADIAKISAPRLSITEYVNVLADLASQRRLLNMIQEVQNMQKDKPIEECWRYVEANILQINHHITAKVMDFNQLSGNIVKDIQNTMNNPKSIIGVTTGFNYLNELTSGFKPGELIILAGRPSVGKTAMALNMATSCAQNKKYGGAVLFISLEMTPDQIGRRIMARLSGIPLRQFTHGYMSQEHFRSLNNILPALQHLPIFTYDSFVLTIPRLRSILRQYKRTHNIKLVVIDYLQLITSHDRHSSREQEVSDISRSLKLLSKEIEVPILALSQMSRDIEKRQSSSAPKLSDLRSSGAIEQDADVVLFLYRQISEDVESRSRVVCSIAKNRNGALGEILLNYQGEITNFEELNKVEHRSES